MNIRKAVAGLTPERRKLVEARHFEQKSWKAVGKEMNRSKSWLMAEHRVALRQLKRALYGLRTRP